ncbi:hypothetical protein ACQ4PT_066760 [Festuca glaucescens]
MCKEFIASGVADIQTMHIDTTLKFEKERHTFAESTVKHFQRVAGFKYVHAIHDLLNPETLCVFYDIQTMHIDTTLKFEKERHTFAESTVKHFQRAV